MISEPRRASIYPIKAASTKLLAAFSDNCSKCSDRADRINYVFRSVIIRSDGIRYGIFIKYFLDLLVWVFRLLEPACKRIIFFPGKTAVSLNGCKIISGIPVIRIAVILKIRQRRKCKHMKLFHRFNAVQDLLYAFAVAVVEFFLLPLHNPRKPLA